ncbi:MAG TPA: glutamate racemase [Candidatus Nanoarchaeia archaeon]|nr:glutamate racemase [uncultured archaeon]
MDNRPIGILDSGFGGLSILASVKEILPKEAIIYFGDSAFAPYGEKEPELIRTRVLKIINFLKKNNVKLVVVACNTATVVGIDYYRSKSPSLPIVGVVPVVKRAASVAKNKRIALLATAKTIASPYQGILIRKFARGFEVKQVAADSLVKELENGQLEQAKKDVVEIVRKEALNSFDTLVLGCTHFVFLKKALTEAFPNLSILDSSEAVARQVKRILENNRALGEGKFEKFFTSGETGKFREGTEKLLERKISQVESLPLK